MRTLIKNATVINEGEEYNATLLIEDETILAIYRNGETFPEDADDTVEAQGMYVLPGVIDDHVHMRDPGLTHKADMASETRAAVAGGVTSVMDMPNVLPQTTTISLWKDKMNMASNVCHANYAFYLGATYDNLNEIKQMDTSRIPALKMFMGSSTGGMLVDKENKLRQIFQECPSLIMAHCEDTARINERMKEAKEKCGEDPSVEYHPWVRDDIACYQSTALAVRLAKESNARLHIAHITTEKELSLLEKGEIDEKRITAEVCPQHLFYTDKDYQKLGSLIKSNPAIKSERDREALRNAAREGLIDVVGTDHAPHLLSEKEGGAAKAVSGMPIIQFSLPLMLTMADNGTMTLTRVVEMMCHNPARLFRIKRRGFIRPGYKADIVLVKKEAWVVDTRNILSKCGWSPLTGEQLNWRVMSTWCNGHKVFDGSNIDDSFIGQALEFGE